MNITVIGVGFVGLVTSVYFASHGHNVVCYDKDKKKIELAKNGESHFFEIGLEKKIKTVLGKTLKFTDDCDLALKASDIIFVCVGTPTVSGKIDLSALMSISKNIAFSLIDSSEAKTIVIKSTVVPGTASDVLVPIIEKHSGKKEGVDFLIASNPEFLREGTAVWDMFNPDRIIVGSNDPSISEKVLDLYPENSKNKFAVSLSTAELAKYSSNVFFATLISFSNEIARLCEVTPGADVGAIFKMLHNDRRLSIKTPNGIEKAELCSYLWPGLGFGGSCFPKDLAALIEYSDKKFERINILNAVHDVNISQTRRVVESFLQQTKPSNVTLLGLSFKPDTDDCRHSKSLEIIEILQEYGVEVTVYDPLVKRLDLRTKIVFAMDAIDAVRQSDAVIIATSWKEFQTQEFVDCLIASSKPVLDARLSLYERKNEIQNNYFSPGVNQLSDFKIKGLA
jgi:UDPglucose 6-dehydrogenase/GDP-mannose 6-dehydrogenase